MASLSYGDMPLTSVRKAAARSGPTSGSSRGLRAPDPEKADILRGGGGGGKLVASVDDVEAWDAADGGAGGDGAGGGSRTTVWRTALCRYRHVLGGIAALVLAALLVGIAIGAHEGRSGSGSGSGSAVGSAAASAYAARGAGPDAGEGSAPQPPKADAVPPHGEIPGGGLPGKGGMKGMGADDELEVEADTSSDQGDGRESGDAAGLDPEPFDGSALASLQTIAVAAGTMGDDDDDDDDDDLSLSLPRRRRRRRVVARPAVWGGKHKKISPNERDELDEEARGSSKRWLGDESLER